MTLECHETRYKYNFNKKLFCLSTYQYICNCMLNMSIYFFSICNETFHCKYHGFLIKKKIAAKYNAYMFIRECIKFQNSTKFQHYEQLMRNLFFL